MIKDYYMILGVPPTATLEEIKVVYREKMQFSHPDQWQNNPRMCQKAEEHAKDINEAYAVLSNPTKRKAYDDSRRSREASFQETPPEQSSSPSPAPSRQSPSSPHKHYVLPDLIDQGSVQRLKFGHIRNAALLGDEQVLLISAAGARLLDVGSGAVHGLTFSPDGERLASGSWDGAVQLWRMG